MRRAAPALTVFAIASNLLLPSGLWSCTYDFDRFEQDSRPSSGAGGNEGGRSPIAGASSGGAPAAGSGAGGAHAGLAGTAGRSGSAEGGAGGSDEEPGGGRTGGASSGGATAGGGASGRGGSGAAGDGASGSGSASLDCGRVSGTAWNGHCYFLASSGAALRWDAARTACGQGSSAHLVTITTEAEQTMLDRTFAGRGNDDLWIGLSLQSTASDPGRDCERNPSQCPFHWVGGEALEYTNWAEHSPSDQEPNYSGACVRVQGDDFRWADLGCTTQLQAICEHDG